MFSPEEKKFIDYWQQQRLRRKSFANRASSGLPLGVAIVAALFLALVSGWYGRATAVLRVHGSVILMVMLGAVGIVVFFSLFSASHEWDQNESKYQSLLQREKNQATSSS